MKLNYIEYLVGFTSVYVLVADAIHFSYFSEFKLQPYINQITKKYFLK